VNVIFRVLQRLLVSVRKDLERPHAFAAERVGFLYGRQARTSEGCVVLAVAFEPVEDDHYVDDPRVGARIGSPAIRRAMQRALSSGDCVFHVHAHFGSRYPQFSGVDVDNLSELIPPFFSVSGGALHGGLVLGDEYARGLLWASRDGKPLSANMRYVGLNLALLGSIHG
jgi:hypothetical protein